MANKNVSNVLLLEEFDDARMKLLAGVFIAQLYAECIDFIRLLFVTPVHLQLRLPIAIQPARISSCYQNNENTNKTQREQVSLGWLRRTAIERRSLAGELSLSCARPVADG